MNPGWYAKTVADVEFHVISYVLHTKKAIKIPNSRRVLVLVTRISVVIASMNLTRKSLQNVPYFKYISLHNTLHSSRHKWSTILTDITLCNVMIYIKKVFKITF